eukprot:TRINITY_DN2918_c0_g1_i2.p1 TRINITY_DN2918_c0_g1~~TRINITY_DN2918_c0_g1_i2.p1  ORF type:complete len:356 (+),score=52.23 TRINITY_DN2918_c0_g1_i2:326-1393(+)
MMDIISEKPSGIQRRIRRAAVIHTALQIPIALQSPLRLARILHHHRLIIHKRYQMIKRRRGKKILSDETRRKLQRDLEFMKINEIKQKIREPKKDGSQKILDKKQKLEDKRKALKQLQKSTPKISVSDMKKEELEKREVLAAKEIECEICLCDKDYNECYKLLCNHSYHEDCMAQQLDVLIAARQFPLRCQRPRCGKEIEQSDLENLLDEKGLELLAKARKDHFVNTHRDTYGYCFTPDCDEIFSKEENPEFFTCISCGEKYCIPCQEVYHEGQNCEEFQKEKREREEQMLNNQLFQQYGFKPCPNCGVPVEKVSGCNRVPCACGAHFCWVCGKFHARTSQPVYQHLQNAHGGYW